MREREYRDSWEHVIENSRRGGPVPVSKMATDVGYVDRPGGTGIADASRMVRALGSVRTNSSASFIEATHPPGASATLVL